MPSVDQLSCRDDGKEIRDSWFKINFIGADSTAKSLRKIAEFFGDELTKRTEEAIAEEMEKVEAVRKKSMNGARERRRCSSSGDRGRTIIRMLLGEIGIETIAAGYEFAHRDDYEGRKVLPSIVVDADSRNIEELTVTADEKDTSRGSAKRKRRSGKRKDSPSAITTE